ncbi:MAG: heterodisulfide reductase-related iron-sulfur binding cluster, partial [Candidatus Binataceae bacterium]
AFSEPGEAFRDSHAQAQARGGAAPERAILWLGCNVLRTPHLAELAMKMMRMVNPELSILGGPSHCCGSPMTAQSDRERALGRTIGHFQAEQAPTLVSWCPSCHTNLRSGSDAASWGFDELHITEFLARRIDRLKFRPRVSARVMLHGHTGTPDRDRDMEYCRMLLNAVPGITIVAEHTDPDLGVHCVPALIAAKISLEAYERKVQALIAQARAAGAEMLVTIYHSCYRETEKRLRDDTPVIENYMTLLAKALDMTVAPNVYREIAHGGDARFERLACEAEARVIDRGELERAVKSEFPSSRSNR